MISNSSRKSQTTVAEAEAVAEAVASEMVVIPLYPDSRRLRARSSPDLLPPPLPLDITIVVLTPSTIAVAATAAAPRVSLRSFPFQVLFFCPTVRHSRVHRDKAAASVPFYQSAEKISRGSCRPACSHSLEIESAREREREREQPSGMLREYKYINTLHVYTYIALQLPLAFVWPREMAWTSR